jgi:hypothetical protein
LLNAETLATGDASVAINRGPAPGMADQGTTFQISFASAPTATVIIQGSNVDLAADYVDLYTSTNKQFDTFTDVTRFAFYRAKMSAYSAGGACTVTVQR